jgi:hypothetical protein
LAEITDQDRRYEGAEDAAGFDIGPSPGEPLEKKRKESAQDEEEEEASPDPQQRTALASRVKGLDSQEAEDNGQDEGAQAEDLQEHFGQGGPDLAPIIMGLLPGGGDARPGRIVGIVADQADEGENGEEQDEKADDLGGAEAFLPGVFLLGGGSLLLFPALHWGDYSILGGIF